MVPVQCHQIVFTAQLTRFFAHEVHIPLTSSFSTSFIGLFNFVRGHQLTRNLRQCTGS